MIDSSQKEFEIVSNFIELLKTTPDFRTGMFDIKFDQSVREDCRGSGRPAVFGGLSDSGSGLPAFAASGEENINSGHRLVN